jgi:hypothetical protein
MEKRSLGKLFLKFKVAREPSLQLVRVMDNVARDETEESTLLSAKIRDNSLLQKMGRT